MSKITVNHFISHDGMITQETAFEDTMNNIRDIISMNVINMQEEGMTRALWKLGWFDPSTINDLRYDLRSNIKLICQEDDNNNTDLCVKLLDTVDEVFEVYRKLGNEN